MDLLQNFRLALDHHQAGRLGEAESLYRGILKEFPLHADSWNNLGLIILERGEIRAASECFIKAIETDKAYADPWNNLGICHRRKKRFDLAMEYFSKAIELNPRYLIAMNNLGFMYRATGHENEARGQFERILSLDPGFAEARWNLAVLHQDLGEYEPAEAHLRILLENNPKHVEALGMMGFIRQRQKRLDEAEAYYQQSIGIKPCEETRVNLGVLYLDVGEIDRGLEVLNGAAKDYPHQQTAWSNALYGLHFQPGITASRVLEGHREWDRTIASWLNRGIVFANGRDPDRRLKVGFVSPDFREHTVMRNVLPLLRERNPSEYEAFCYNDSARRDAYTEQCRQLADSWVESREMTGDELADRVLADGIDILVDLACHSAENRMLVFASKPAPVQVSWVGYPGTTGLKTMDYRLSDAWIDPPEYDGNYVEKTIRLRNYWCYDPLGDCVPANESPWMKNGHVTFGNLCHSGKVNDEVARTWAEILRRVPGSKLVLLGLSKRVRERISRVFRESLGGFEQAESRLIFVDKVNREDYLKRYWEIDAVLDTFPYNGPSTGMDALYMGVPVVSLSGELGVGRGGASILNAVGVGDLVGRTREEYMEIAVKLGHDRGRLAELRRELRNRMEKSALMDIPGFAREMEKAFRRMWRRWIEEGNR